MSFIYGSSHQLFVLYASYMLARNSIATFLQPSDEYFVKYSCIPSLLRVDMLYLTFSHYSHF